MTDMQTLAGPAYRFVNAMADDGYDHAVDHTLPPWFHGAPGLIILSLRPRFSLSVPHLVRKRGVAAWRGGFRLGRQEVTR